MNRQPFSENITLDISETNRADIQGLIEESNRYDGIDFPFTLDELPSTSDEHSTTLLYTASQKILGLLCLYNWSGIELYGLVHPTYRRRGIGQALLTAAKEIARQHEQPHLLLGCHGSIPSALAFAEANQATFSHADYHMIFNESAVQRSTSLHAELALRRADATEIGQVASIAAQAFGEPEEEMCDWLTKDVLKPQQRIFFIELQGNPIGTIRIVETASKRSDLTLFCLLQPYRGRGYGRQILLSSVDLLLSEQCSHIALDVTTSNSNALALYQTCGFQEVRKDSYYKFVL
jgi:ribosomal protein S18 acetylase RimI-like enzyme